MSGTCLIFFKQIDGAVFNWEALYIRSPISDHIYYTRTIPRGIDITMRSQAQPGRVPGTSPGATAPNSAPPTRQAFVLANLLLSLFLFIYFFFYFFLNLILFLLNLILFFFSSFFQIRIFFLHLYFKTHLSINFSIASLISPLLSIATYSSIASLYL